MNEIDGDTSGPIRIRPGGGGELVAFYERQGFTPTEPFLSGTWPGQVLARRVGVPPGRSGQTR
ncbi:hypothetical protein CW362_34715 [Streptomyces populi]|uniref:Uncharacterized protein n=1 Tax=Streptomyces populi TaxID=2058924 RepID=A0A2I0SEZ7_9ACTN|nr:hypothetical protein [Streptomyces populi]PKT68495.1 hypothetical protein CW362_34715 [Streptomyces populi]